jgi:hypothetical protein
MTKDLCSPRTTTTGTTERSADTQQSLGSALERATAAYHAALAFGIRRAGRVPEKGLVPPAHRGQVGRPAAPCIDSSNARLVTG